MLVAHHSVPRDIHTAADKPALAAAYPLIPQDHYHLTQQQALPSLPQPYAAAGQNYLYTAPVPSAAGTQQQLPAADFFKATSPFSKQSTPSSPSFPQHHLLPAIVADQPVSPTTEVNLTPKSPLEGRPSAGGYYQEQEFRHQHQQQLEGQLDQAADAQYRRNHSLPLQQQPQAYVQPHRPASFSGPYDEGHIQAFINSQHRHQQPQHQHHQQQQQPQQFPVFYGHHQHHGMPEPSYMHSQHQQHPQQQTMLPFYASNLYNHPNNVGLTHNTTGTATLGVGNTPAPAHLMTTFNSNLPLHASYHGRHPGGQGAHSNPTKKHACTICGKRFTRPSSLQTHVYSHTGEKPFLCKVGNCGRRFSVVSNLRRHRKIHGNAAE